MEQPKSRVYAKLDDGGNILRIEGEYTLPDDLSGWTLIDEGTPCDRLNLAQSHYFPGGIYTEYGIPRYKYIDGEIYQKTDDELATELADEQAKPTLLDELEAQVTYTAMMTDTLLSFS